MNHPASYHIFRKHGWLLVLCIAILIAGKFFVYHRIPQSTQEVQTVQKQWYQELKDYPLISETELDAADYLYVLYEQYIGSLPPQNERTPAQHAAYQLYFSAWKDVNTAVTSTLDVNHLILFTRNGTGFLPPNFLRTPIEQFPYISTYDEPKITSPLELDLFFRLQGTHLVYLILAFLSVVVWGKYYEAEISITAQIAFNGRKYQWSLRLWLCVFCLFFTLLNDGMDVLISGVYQNPDVWSASLQSFSSFSSTYANLSIGDAVIILMVARFICNVALCFAAEYLATILRSVRNTGITLASALMLLFFFARTLQYTDWASALFLGYSPMFRTIQSACYISFLNSTTLHVALVINIFALIITSFCLWLKSKQNT